MKKGKIASFNKKASIKNAKFSINYLLMVLTLVPLFFSAIFQGGYFPWETYLTFLLSVPAILLFIITKFKTNESENSIRKSGVDLSLLVFLVVCFLSLFFTVYFHTTLTEFFKVLIYLVLFYIALNTINGERGSNIIIFSVLGLSAILSILGLIGYVGYKLNLSTSFFIFASRYGFTQGGRIASTLQYSNTFAAFLIIPIFISFSGFISEAKLARKIIYLVLSLLFVLTFFLTQSRGALVAFVISILVYLLLLKGKDRRFSLLTFGILVACVSVVFLVRKDVFLPVFHSLFERIKVMFSFFRGNWEESLGDRVYMLKDSLRILKDYPVLGTRNGTYQYVYAKYRTIYFFSKFPHSIFFQVLDDLGVLGGAAFAYMIFSLFKKGFRAIRENYSAILVGVYVGLFGMFLHALVDFDWSLIFMPLIFFYLFALIISYGKKEYFTFKCPIIEKFSKKKQPAKSFKTFDSRTIHAKRFRSLGIALTIVLASIFLFQFLASFANFKAKGSIGLIEWQGTVSKYKTATSLDFLAAEYHYDLANYNFTYLIPSSQDTTQSIQEAVSHYGAAIKHCPEFFLYHFELGKLYLQTGNEKAIDEFTKTLQLNPLDPGAHATLGFAYLNLKKDTVMSKIQFEEALRLDSKNSDAFIGMGSLYEKSNDPDKALENYKLAIKYDSKNAYAYYRTGIIYENKGMLPEAVSNLFWAVHYNPNLIEAKTEFEKYAPIITIAKPQKAEIIKVGTIYEISWLPSNSNNVEYYNIVLIPKKGEWITAKSGIPTGTITYKYEVPQNLEQGEYKLRIYAVAPKFMQGKSGNWLSYEEVQIKVNQ